tara:strand:- start:77 stop:1852 length:1776 start_codon:yes stop_codon:yes gene_type:complete
MLGITYVGNSFPLTLTSSPLSVGLGISDYFGLSQSVQPRVGSYQCFCSGTACSCLDIPGTGHTGNYYSLESDCLVAANSNPCCTPPDNYWHCEPQNTQGTPNGDCLCVQQSGFGGYPTLLDCKNDGGNCCDKNTYDCMHMGTQLQGCYGMVFPNIGPYQTIAQCYDDCPKEGYNCQIIEDDGPGSSGPGGSGYLGCVPCIGTSCQFTNVTAAASPYFGDALLQCQDNCPAKDCWKCCMNKAGQIYQLSPSTPPAQCKCGIGTVEVECGPTGPCPYPVSCAPGLVYSHVYCKCVCEINQSCSPGNHWSYVECKCVPNVMGPVDYVGPQGKVLQSISDFIYQPVHTIINEFIDGLEVLEYYIKKNYRTSSCSHCTDDTNGICVVGGCLYFIDYKKYGTTQVGWKSLLVNANGEQVYIEPTTSSTLPPGPITEGYSCRVDQNNAPTYTTCIHTGSPDYVSYFGNMPPLYATLQDCYNDGCDTPTAIPTTPTVDSPFSVVPVNVPPNTPMPSNNWGQGKSFADGYVCAYAPYPVGAGIGCYLSINGVYTNSNTDSPNYGNQYGLPCVPWYAGGNCFEYQHSSVGVPACQTYCLNT